MTEAEKAAERQRRIEGRLRERAAWEDQQRKRLDAMRMRTQQQAPKSSPVPQPLPPQRGCGCTRSSG